MNRWKNYIWMAAGVSALSVVGAFTAKPLLAQIRAALVQNVDEPGRNPYSSYIFVRPENCVQLTCSVQFDAIPAGKRLVATSVIGTIPVARPGIITFFFLYSPQNQNTKPAQWQIPTSLIGTDMFSDRNLFGVSSQLTSFFEPNTTPKVDFGTTGSVSDFGVLGSITLSGYLVSLP
jgi:hypothetical protein